MRLRYAVMLVLAALVGALPLRAQDPADAAARDSLQARVRARMGQVLRTQLGLNDEQMRRLQATNQRFEGERRTLFEQERRTRIELRAALELGDSTQQVRVGQLLDRTLQLQRQRLDLLEQEQKELATFLTPIQRARLYGLEEQMRRRVEEMREARPGPPGAGPARRPLGGRPGAGVRRPPPGL